MFGFPKFNILSIFGWASFDFAKTFTVYWSKFFRKKTNSTELSVVVWSELALMIPLDNWNWLSGNFTVGEVKPSTSSASHTYKKKLFLCVERAFLTVFEFFETALTSKQENTCSKSIKAVNIFGVLEIKSDYNISTTAVGLLWYL